MEPKSHVIEIRKIIWTMHLHFWVQILKGIPQFRKRSHQMIVYLEKIFPEKKNSKNHAYPERHGPPFISTSGCFNWMMNQFFTEEIGCISPFPSILNGLASGYQVHKNRKVLPRNGWKKNIIQRISGKTHWTTTPSSGPIIRSSMHKPWS